MKNDGLNMIDRMRLAQLPEDDIEPPQRTREQYNPFLSAKKLAFVAAWTGNLMAAARTAGYKHPKVAAYKLMKDPEVIKALQKKQNSMLEESGEHLAHTLPLSRADVIDRLWQLAQLSPGSTNGSITGQVKAAQALEEIFALNIDQNDLLKRQLEGRSQEELEFYVVHGFLPHQEPKPALAAPADALQLPESTVSEPQLASATPEPLSTQSSQSTESIKNADPNPQ